MNVEELSMIGPNVDLETVNAINKKRLLAFVNHFIVNTTLFLNKLSKSCEHSLMSLENKIQRLETSIVILESKLNSVPGLAADEVAANASPLPKENKEKESESESRKTEKDTENEEKSNESFASGLYEAKEDECEKPQLDASLMKYVKMLQFGVPQQAVKLKMEQENIDESLHNLILNYNK